MRQFAVILLLVLGFAVKAEAQSFLEKLKEKKQGEGTVTVSQSAAIDELVNNAKLTIKPQQQPAQPQRQAERRQQQQTEQRQQHATQSQQAKPAQQQQTTTAKKDLAGDSAKEHRTTAKQTETETELTELSTVKKVPRVNRKVTGYRVQAYAGGNSRTDRAKAEDIKNAIKARYPELPVYVHFYSPRWICRVGNFRTFEEASSALKNIKAMGYKQACIVKGKINVGY